MCNYVEKDDAFSLRSDSFTISGVNDGVNSVRNLQDAFRDYKQKKQKELRRVRKRNEVKDEARLRCLADPSRMWNLRMKFLEQAKKYFGVPYAKKYWKKEDMEFHSRYFLDCCGLVRRVQRDLWRSFGFKLGPWNQAYMFDTLPLEVTEREMQPGDLVFISGVYYSPKKKRQRHDMVHVEIWLGEGPKTIGARWNNGKVQVFDSYAFTAKSYHSEEYYFRSIDTWLQGICRSYCSVHPWKTRAERFKPEKKSIFKPLSSSENESDQSAGNSSDSGETVSTTVFKSENAPKFSTKMENTPKESSSRTKPLLLSTNELSSKKKVKKKIKKVSAKSKKKKKSKIDRPSVPEMTSYLSELSLSSLFGDVEDDG